ncbi:hypothetical protein [Bacteroides gallinarum]|uniref:hypothetical protein n=1 Tax=Bacteroides gallinarum TaxID=376806 RepID=UPI000366B1A5|nr:hypothetical protein [Bacteroides gallinarum]
MQKYENKAENQQLGFLNQQIKNEKIIFANTINASVRHMEDFNLQYAQHLSLDLLKNFPLKHETKRIGKFIFRGTVAVIPYHSNSSPKRLDKLV